MSVRSQAVPDPESSDDPARLVGVHAASAASGVTVKPAGSMLTKTPPEVGLVVHWPPHSTVLAACQAGPAGRPCVRASAATIEVSVARPATTTSAPASSAPAMGGVPHQADDMGAGRGGAGAELAAWRQWPDPALVDGGDHGLGPQLAVDARHPEGQAVLRGDSLGDRGDLVHARVSARGAAAAHDERYPVLPGRGEQDPQVPRHGGIGRLGHAGAQVVRARVGRPRVDGDRGRAHGDAALDRFGGEASAEHS
jgi:hypothetical protein